MVSALRPMDATNTAAMQDFICENTVAVFPALLPEISLRLASEAIPIWQKSEEVLGQLNVPPPYWAFAWPGGQALARYLLDHPNFVASKRILDLGAGSGLAGIAAMKAGAAHVLASDIDIYALAAAEMNARANGVSVELTSENLLDKEPDAFDVVLVGDLFYERRLAAIVLTFAERAAAAGALVLIGDPQRNYFPRGRFQLAAQYPVPVTRDLEDTEIKTTAVWRL